MTRKEKREEKAERAIDGIDEPIRKVHAWEGADRELRGKGRWKKRVIRNKKRSSSE